MLGVKGKELAQHRALVHQIKGCNIFSQDHKVFLIEVVYSLLKLSKFQNTQFSTPRLEMSFYTSNLGGLRKYFI